MTDEQIKEIARDLNARQIKRGIQTGPTVQELAVDLREIFNLHIAIAFTREDVKTFARELGYVLSEHNITECVQDFMPGTAPIADIKKRLRIHITRLGKKLEPLNAGNRRPDSEKKEDTGARRQLSSPI
jgi:hypothetical protein